MRFIIAYLLLVSTLFSAHEKDYQEHANKTIFHGEVEKVLEDGTRVDIFVKDKYAVEVDFAKKWYEAIGQSAHYAHMTNTPPAIYLIVRSDNDLEKLQRARDVCSRLYIVLDGKIVGFTVFHVDDRNGKVSDEFDSIQDR